MYTNADGVLNKREELQTLLQEFNPDIIAVTELIPKNLQNFELVEYQIPGYTLFVNSKPERGTALYLKYSLNANECTDLNKHDFQESVWCTFNSKENLTVLVGCVYKSPNSGKNNIDNLYDLLLKASQLNYDKICIVGDFNYPTLNWNGAWSNESDEKFLECTRDAFLNQMVIDTTRRRQGQKPSLLDLVLVNDTSLISDIVHHCPLGKSDHDILLFSLYVNEKDKDTGDDKFNLAKGNYEGMREELNHFDWSDLYISNVEELVFD